MLFCITSLLTILIGQSPGSTGAVTTSQTDHLTFSAGASVDAVAPGDRVSLIFEIQPRRNMHVYAPGKHGYQIVNVTIDPQPWLRVHQTQYPQSEIFHFKPLDERVPVYQKPFRITKDITVLASAAAQKILAGRRDVTVTGRFDYQACDEKLCYRPQSVPVRWTLMMKPAHRKPRG